MFPYLVQMDRPFPVPLSLIPLNSGPRYILSCDIKQLIKMSENGGFQ